MVIVMVRIRVRVWMLVMVAAVIVVVVALVLGETCGARCIFWGGADVPAWSWWLAASGLGLTLIHLVSIPVTNTSVNPARSTGVALFAETAALNQLWLFWLAPLAGAAIGAIIWRLMLAADEAG